MQTNKGDDFPDSRMARAVRRTVRYLREWPARHGRTVHNQVIRGASYSLGSGAVSLLIIWFEARR